MSLSNFLHRQYQKWRYHTAANAFEKRVAEINRHSKKIHLQSSLFQIDNCNLNFSKEHHAFILEQLDLFHVLLQDGEFVIRENHLYYTIDGLTLPLTTAEEIFIIHEIFCVGTYAFSKTGKFSVIDIGMNVGYASLFFAKNDQVNVVFSFEPVTMTYDQALRNFQMNPGVAASIKPVNYGLADEGKNVEIEYSYESKGQVGKHGVFSNQSERAGTQRVPIALQEASAALKAIFQKNATERFILKMDCEGAEYGIMQNLAANKMLSFFDVIMIEWHTEGPLELLRILNENHFTSFYQQSATKKVGMIYASR